MTLRLTPKASRGEPASGVLGVPGPGPAPPSTRAGMALERRDGPRTVSPFQTRKEEPFPAPPCRSERLASPAVAPPTRSTVLDTTSGPGCKGRSRAQGPHRRKERALTYVGR